MGETLTDLKTLTDKWKHRLQKGVKMVEQWQLEGDGREVRRRMVGWIKSQCIKTTTGQIVCVYCGLICSEQDKPFNHHMINHWFRVKQKKKQCKKKSHICPECGKGFYDNLQVKKHAKRIHNIEIEGKVGLKKCAFCKEMVPEREINGHRKEFHQNEKVECQKCEKTFMTPSLYKQHFKNMHTTAYTGFCDICQKEVPQLSKHKSEKHKDSPCSHCDRVFTNPFRLENHMKSVNGTMQRKQCPECSSYFVNLRDHILRTHRGEPKPYQKNGIKCLKCYKWIPKDQYKSHQDSCTIQTQTCSICQKEVRQLEMHLINHSEGVKCVLCPEMFSARKVQYGKLNDHIYEFHIPDIFMEFGIIDDLHTKNNTRRDEIADFFVDKKSVKKDKKNVCVLCEKSFGTRTWMIYHMKTHLRYQVDKRPKTIFPCTECGKMVSTKKMDQHKCKSQVENTHETFQHIEFGTKTTEYIPEPLLSIANNTISSMVELESFGTENTEQNPATFIEPVGEMPTKPDEHEAYEIYDSEPTTNIFETFNNSFLGKAFDNPEANALNPDTKYQDNNPEVPMTKKQKSEGLRSKKSEKNTDKNRKKNTSCQCIGCLTPKCGSCSPCLNPRYFPDSTVCHISPFSYSYFYATFFWGGEVCTLLSFFAHI